MTLAVVADRSVTRVVTGLRDPGDQCLGAAGLAEGPSAVAGVNCPRSRSPPLLPTLPDLSAPSTSHWRRTALEWGGRPQGPPPPPNRVDRDAGPPQLAVLRRSGACYGNREG